MEINGRVSSTKECCHETLPSLVKFITAIEVASFDSVKGQNDLNNQREPTEFQYSFGPSLSGVKSAATERMHCVSISMPPSPVGVHLPNTRRVFFKDHHDDDKRFDSFRTLSGRLERQLSNLGGKNRNNEDESDDAQPQAAFGNLPVDRYFDALEGPELDTLRASEKILLPEDKKWPFLLRYPVTSFGICLGVSSQAILWKTLATSDSTRFLHVSLDVNLVLWCISIALVAIVGLIYVLKMVFYFEAVRREYYHPIRVNFFFAPWITLLFLAIGAPPSVDQNLHEALWYVLMTPIFFLELKIYGQWISGGQRRLSKVANPSNHLSIIGNFVGALLGASMGLKEGPIFFFAVGMAHYIALFVTLYQRLPTNETLPKELHPVFFLFVAVPSAASMAWTSIQGSFDYGSRIAYFIALFLYFSLVVRINFFRGVRFSLAWWAYTFPTTGVAIATIKYSNAITNPITNCLAMTLSAVATLTVTAMLITTIFHAFVLQDLFPNDIAIAITETKPHKTTQEWYHNSIKSSEDKKDIKYYFEYLDFDGKDIVGCFTPPSNTNQENCTSGENEVHININSQWVPPS